MAIFKNKTKDFFLRVRNILAKRLFGPIRVGYVVFLAAAVMAVGLVVSLKSEAAAPGTYYYLLPPPGYCPNENTVNASQATSRQSMACLTNYVRRKAGLRNLDYRLRMHSASYGKSFNLMACQYFAHSGKHPATGCSVRNMTYWLGRNRVNCGARGEILAWGSGYLGSPRNTMKAWLDSDGHRRVILMSHFTRAGTGIRSGTFRGVPGVKMWTQIFGSNCRES